VCVLWFALSFSLFFPFPLSFLRTTASPFHYCTQHSFVGPTLLRRKQLRQLGWQVVHVPWFDFRRAVEPKARRVYLEALIRGAVAERLDSMMAV
jgi:hypothetical protein